MTEIEIWKPISGYADRYEVSNFGRVRGRTRVLKPFYRGRQYQTVRLFKDTEAKDYSVHRLVAEMFIPNPTGLPCVNHIDGNKNNNYTSNLEWCTQSQNIQHAYLHDLKLANERRVFCLEEKTEYRSASEAARQFGITPWDVVSCCRGERQQTHGVHFIYADVFACVNKLCGRPLREKENRPD